MIRKIALMGALAVAAVFGANLMKPATPEATSFPFGAANAQEAGDIDTSQVVEMSMGAADAPITMIEYASFSCPHCGAFHEGTLKEIKKNYIDTGKVRLIYREVYFDKYGLWASMVARCGGPEKFFGITDLIYKDQAEWTKLGDPTEIVDAFRKMGRQAGLDDEKLNACLQDGEKAQMLVAWYQKNATADDIQGTPSFIVNGKKVANQSYDDFAALFDAELGG